MKHFFTLFLTLIFAFAQAQVNPVLLNNNIAPEELFPNSIAYYNGEIYIPDFEGNRILKTSATSTNAPVVEVLTDVSLPSALQVIGDELFILQSITTANPTNDSGKLSKIDLTQANPSVVDVITGLNIPFQLSVSGGDFYITEIIGNFMSNDLEDLQFDSFSISKIDMQATPSKNVLVTNRDFIYGFTVSESELFWVEETFNSDAIFSFSLGNTSSAPSLFYEFDIEEDEIAFGLYFYNGKLLFSSLTWDGFEETGNIKAIDVFDNQNVENVSTDFVFGSYEVIPTAMTVHNNELFVSASSFSVQTFDERELLYTVDVSTLSTTNPEALQASIQFYPNPTSHYFSIESLVDIVSLELYSLNGKQVMKLPYTEGEQIDVSHLTKGVYFLKMNTANGALTQKLIKR